MRSSSRFSLAACSAAAALVLAACSGGNTANPGSGDEESSQAAGRETLVIDTAFSLETGDPGRTYVPTGNMVLHAVYDTLLTFEGSDEERSEERRVGKECRTRWGRGDGREQERQRQV